MIATLLRRFVLVLIVGVSMGCDRESTVMAPTPPVTQGVFIPYIPPIVPPENLWLLTRELVSIEGPKNCFSDQYSAYKVQEAQMEVRRGGGTIWFDFDVRYRPLENLVEMGRMNGRSFTAASDPLFLYQICGGVQFNGPYDARVTGSFADDDEHLTGSEVVTYYFSSGQVVMTYDWKAVKAP
jgi:hypothetical protein